MKIVWNEQTDENKYILEIEYKNGTKGYLKNADYKVICHWYDIASKVEDMVGLTLFSTTGKVIATKCKAAA
jgi:hypothetical protein